LPYKHGIPSHDTFGLVFASIDAKLFSAVFIEWAQSLQKEIPQFVAIDGKTVRRSKNGAIAPIHMVSAWAVQQHMVLGQTKTDEKSNEITAIPYLLSILSLKGAIVTLDAMGCQKAIAGEIKNKQAEYVLAVKENQPRLFGEIDLLAQAYDSQTFPIEFATCKTVDSDHGRIETREYFTTDRLDLLPCAMQWPGIKSFGMVRSEREIGGVSTQNVRYYISSLAADPFLFAKAVRNHWGIENSLHWVMDIVFRDDECRVRKKNAPANFVTVKHITQNMLKSLPGKSSMRVRRKKAGWDDEFLAAALAAKIAP
jgi:predicted transposase YbfD/YdcC